MFKRRPQLSGFLVGFIVTAIATFICFRVFDAKLQVDRDVYDVRVREFNTIEADDRIVHVDIDDSAVDEVGRWPWRRERIADLLSVINELGAKYILVDLLISEQELPYYDDPRLDPDRDIDPDMQFIGDTDSSIVMADQDLARVVHDAGNVIMAVQMDARSPGGQRSIEERLASLLGQTPDISESDAMTALSLEDRSEEHRAFREAWLRFRVARALSADFTLDAQALAKVIGADHRDVERIIAGAKREAAGVWIKRLFDSNPALTLADAREAIFGSRAARMHSDDQDIRKAYRAYLGLQDVSRKLVTPRQIDANDLYSADSIVPVLHPIGEAALDVAAVNFSADPDGIVRRVPPLIAYHGSVAMHMGVAGAAHILGLDAAKATLPSSRLMLIPKKDGSGDVEVPLDGAGNMIIPWTRTATRWREGEDFTHLSAAALIEIVDNRQAIEDNDTRLLYEWAEVVKSIAPPTEVTNTETGETTKQYPDDQYRENVRELFEKRVALRSANGPDASALQAAIDNLETAIDRKQKDAAGAVRLYASQIKDVTEAQLAADEGARATVERIRRGMGALDGTIPRLIESNARIAKDIESLIARLRPAIREKFVFVGFAATAQGDIVSTPIDARTNGVMCHANVMNAFLQNRFITPAPEWWEWPACLLAGAIVGWWTAHRSPRFALTSTLALLAGVTAIGCVVIFQRYDDWYALMPFAIVLLFCWSAVTLFRQLTAERDKRVFRAQLSQYTSPAIAARIAESPEAAEAFKKVQTRDMTCYFSDLAGFTTISEREDAELVQHVLNVYLERMSRAIWEHRGLINKFMGDGIMAIFNPSVDPLEDHARVACETALDTLSELESLRREMQSDPASTIFQQLELRIGLAVGDCKNGDMGSELKADYTVIGDVVNLAARLEPANKVFGTRIMISGPLYDRVADDFDVRYLAELQVKGKKNTVPVYELIGRAGTMSDDQRAYVDRFEAGVALYKQRKWDECIVHFTRMLARRPDDLGAGRYIDACQEMKAFAPDDDWAGALELKEK
ncbi:MAG: adenylate/guanylate cyclase domain-containing protein [Phycisphaerales bacterium]|nr:adenylate/guanylate cyclase domain-containing protein [Phycisphaerales bacterium]MCB9856662.1 adenylate/guanylate cyclase domain-containing protein [Phycisphaerales bacterium]MCB9862211.1 adenylate/guanylate cyclase domain-containing protein [Phycisphaerales bacterium]